MIKKLTKWVVVGVMAVAVVAPSFIFADVKLEKPEALQRTSITERMTNKFAERQTEKLDQKGIKDDKKVEHRDRILAVIGQYAPDLQDAFESFWDQHDALHEALFNEHQRLASEAQAEAIAFAEAIKAKVVSGEMTKEAAKLELQSYRESQKSAREAIRLEIEALKASLDIPKEDVQAMFETLKVAVEAGDSAAVTNALEAMIATHPQHLAFDQAKLDLLKNQ